MRAIRGVVLSAMNASLPVWLIIFGLISIGLGVRGGGLRAWFLPFGAALLLVALVLVFKAWRSSKSWTLVRATFGELISNALKERASTDPESRAQAAKLAEKFKLMLERAGPKRLNKPWYLVVGDSACGKTCLLKRAEIGYDLAVHKPDEFNIAPEAYGGTGHAGTYLFDLWFTRYAVMIDTAGEVSVNKKMQIDGLQELLKIVKRARPVRPISGVVLAIPADALRGDPEKFEAQLKSIRLTLDTITTDLGVSYPIWLTITKADLIPGYRAFYAQLPKTVAREMLGWSKHKGESDRPFKPEDAGRIVDEIATRVESHRAKILRSNLQQRCDAALNAREDELPPPEPSVFELYRFANEIRALRSSLETVLRALLPNRDPDEPDMPHLRESASHPFFLNGVYLCSAMQTGRPFDPGLEDLIGATEGDRTSGTSKVAHGITDVFMKKAFNEWALVTPSFRAETSYRRRIVAIAVGCTLLSLVAVGGTWFSQEAYRDAIGIRAGQWEKLAQAVAGREWDEGKRPTSSLSTRETADRPDPAILTALYAVRPDSVGEDRGEVRWFVRPLVPDQTDDELRAWDRAVQDLVILPLAKAGWGRATGDRVRKEAGVDSELRFTPLRNDNPIDDFGLFCVGFVVESVAPTSEFGPPVQYRREDLLRFVPDPPSTAGRAREFTVSPSADDADTPCSSVEPVKLDGPWSAEEEVWTVDREWLQSFDDLRKAITERLGVDGSFGHWTPAVELFFGGRERVLGELTAVASSIRDTLGSSLDAASSASPAIDLEDVPDLDRMRLIRDKALAFQHLLDVGTDSFRTIGAIGEDDLRTARAGLDAAIRAHLMSIGEVRRTRFLNGPDTEIRQMEDQLRGRGRRLHSVVCHAAPADGAFDEAIHRLAAIGSSTGSAVPVQHPTGGGPNTVGEAAETDSLSWLLASEGDGANRTWVFEKVARQLADAATGAGDDGGTNMPTAGDWKAGEIAKWLGYFGPLSGSGATQADDAKPRLPDRLRSTGEIDGFIEYLDQTRRNTNREQMARLLQTVDIDQVKAALTGVELSPGGRTADLAVAQAIDAGVSPGATNRPAVTAEQWSKWIDSEAIEKLIEDLRAAGFDPKEAKDRPEWFKGLSIATPRSLTIHGDCPPSADGLRAVISAESIRTAIEEHWRRLVQWDDQLNKPGTPTTAPTLGQTDVAAISDWISAWQTLFAGSRFADQAAADRLKRPEISGEDGDANGPSRSQAAIANRYLEAWQNWFCKCAQDVLATSVAAREVDNNDWFERVKDQFPLKPDGRESARLDDLDRLIWSDAPPRLPLEFCEPARTAYVTVAYGDCEAGLTHAEQRVVQDWRTRLNDLPDNPRVKRITYSGGLQSIPDGRVQLEIGGVPTGIPIATWTGGAENVAHDFVKDIPVWATGPVRFVVRVNEVVRHTFDVGGAGPVWWRIAREAAVAQSSPIEQVVVKIPAIEADAPMLEIEIEFDSPLEPTWFKVGP